MYQQLLQRAIPQRFNLPTVQWKLSRLTQLLLLAATVLVYSVMGMAVANSLFVTHVGAGHLPLAFILIGLCSMPAYALFSQVVDRYSRPKLFRYVLVLSIGLAIALRFLLTIDAAPVYYILLVFIFFQWDFHNNVLYPSLLTDYFTTLEYKRYAPFVGIAQAVGTLIGGGVTAILTHWISTRNLLLCLPITFAIAILQLLYLERSQRPVTTVNTQQKVSLIEAITSFPGLAKRYPLALLLASSSFLLVIIYLSSEFLWFNIYGQSFSERDLTSFLGIMRIGISVIQVMVIYGLTRPLLQSVGVARMNPVYPLTTLASLVGLAFNVNLPAAIALHVNGDALYKAINLPVHQLNYNAIPREFIGRIRALSDGFIYAAGLTSAGVVLWVCHHLLSLAQITWIAAGLTVLLFLVRWPMGQFYGQGLEDMIRSNTINLDDFTDSTVSLPAQSSPAIQELLVSDSIYLQLQGLKLAANYGTPSEFLADIQLLVQQGDADIRHAAIDLFTHTTDPAMLQQCEQWLQPEIQAELQTSTPSPSARLSAFALEVLIAHQSEIDPVTLETLLNRDPEPELQLLGQMAALQVNPEQLRETHALQSASHVSPALSLPSMPGEAAAPTIEALSETIRHMPLDDAIARTLTRVVSHSRNRTFIPLIKQILPHPSTTLTQQALQALIPLATLEDRDIADIALMEQSHSAPAVRVEVFKLLGLTRCTHVIEQVTEGLGDEDPRVRQQAAKALASYGKTGLALARENLTSSDPERVKSAIAAIGQVRTKYASDILFDYLARDRQQLTRTRKWQQQIPKDDPSWHPLAIAITDYHQRVIQRILYILSCLGHSRTVNTVNRILATTNHQDTENAIEVLASLGHRRFIAPILPLLEQTVNASTSSAPLPTSPKSSPSEDASHLATNPSHTETLHNQPKSKTVRLSAHANVQNPKSKTHPPHSQWLRTKGYKILLEALEVSDRWIKTGAMIALAKVPGALIHDPDPFVQSVASQIFAPGDYSIPSAQSAAIPTVMNRILLLKNVAIFKNLSLDELLLIDQAIEQEQVLADQIIYTEGNWGTHLYIIAEGQVRLVKTIDGHLQDIRTLSKEQYFGEIALFDDAPRWDGAIAMDDCTLLKLEKNRFISLITQRPHIILEVCRFLSQRLRETDTYRGVSQISHVDAVQPTGTAHIDAETVSLESP